MDNTGTGVGRLSAQAEREQTRAAVEGFAKRTIKNGNVPGTHTLGVEFRTVVVEQEIVRSEDINEFHANI